MGRLYFRLDVFTLALWAVFEIYVSGVITPFRAGLAINMGSFMLQAVTTGDVSITCNNIQECLTQVSGTCACTS